MAYEAHVRYTRPHTTLLLQEEEEDPESVFSMMVRALK
jgi:hypothetical protein